MEIVIFYFLSVPPAIDQKEETNQTVVVTRPLFLDCPARGTPPPLIKWYKNGAEIKPEKEPNIRVLGGGQRLEITSAFVSDKGQYKCVATNAAGKTEKKVNVAVHGELVNFIKVIDF